MAEPEAFIDEDREIYKIVRVGTDLWAQRLHKRHRPYAGLAFPEYKQVDWEWGDPFQINENTAANLYPLPLLPIP